MIRIVLFFLLLSKSFQASAQIDMSDSTVQVIAYWQMNETQAYSVSDVTCIRHDEDTTSFEKITYKSNLRIVDSTSVGYLMEWTRSEYNFSSENKFDNTIYSLLEDYPILIQMNEFGSGISILNWEDIGNYIQSKCDSLLFIYASQPNKFPSINKIKRWHSNKEMIESNTIMDIQQFFSYHGARYKLGETIKAKIKIPNNFGGDDLNADAIIVLDEILPQNGTYVLKSFQNIDPAQLRAVTYDYLARLNIEGSALPSFEDFPSVTKQIWGGSEIHGPSGWVIFSQESQEITNGKDTTTKERLIEILEK